MREEVMSEAAAVANDWEGQKEKMYGKRSLFSMDEIEASLGRGPIGTSLFRRRKGSNDSSLTHTSGGSIVTRQSGKKSV